MVDYWLGECYHHVVVKGNGKDALRYFKDAVEADHNLKKLVEERLQKINNQQITDKCFISKKYVEILQAVLTT